MTDRNPKTVPVNERSPAACHEDPVVERNKEAAQAIEKRTSPNDARRSLLRKPVNSKCNLFQL